MRSGTSSGVTARISGVLGSLSDMRSITRSGVTGRWTGVFTDSLALAGEGEGGNLSAILSSTGSGVTGRCELAFVLLVDNVLFEPLSGVGEVGGELAVITNGDDILGERGLSSFSMMESRFEVVILISGKTWFQPWVEATCSMDLKYCSLYQYDAVPSLEIHIP